MKMKVLVRAKWNARALTKHKHSGKNWQGKDAMLQLPRFWALFYGVQKLNSKDERVDVHLIQIDDDDQPTLLQ
jgi:hypothetical protein